LPRQPNALSVWLVEWRVKISIRLFGQKIKDPTYRSPLQLLLLRLPGQRLMFLFHLA